MAGFPWQPVANYQAQPLDLGDGYSIDSSGRWLIYKTQVIESVRAPSIPEVQAKAWALMRAFQPHWQPVLATYFEHHLCIGLTFGLHSLVGPPGLLELLVGRPPLLPHRRSSSGGLSPEALSVTGTRKLDEMIDQYLDEHASFFSIFCPRILGFSCICGRDCRI